MQNEPAVEDRFVPVNGVRLHYLDWGGAGEPLLFLPGHGEPASALKWFAQRFFPRFRPLALTRRGMGKSEIPEGPYTIDQLVDDIRGFLDVIHIQRVSLVGHSLGGAEASFFAAKYPGRVGKLVNLDGCFIDDELHELVKEDPCPSPDHGLAPKEALKSVDAYLDYVRRTEPYVDRLWSPAMREMWIHDLRIDDSGTIEEIDRSCAMSEPIQSVRDKDLDFSKVLVPMLVIVAIQTQYPDVPSDASPDVKRKADEFQARIVETKRAITRRIEQQKPDATILEIVGAAHHCYITHEEATFAHILHFLRE
jgi:pimeloyl-ACP methyl ester carboxylesterase